MCPADIFISLLLLRRTFSYIGQLLGCKGVLSKAFCLVREIEGMISFVRNNASSADSKLRYTHNDMYVKIGKQKFPVATSSKFKVFVKKKEHGSRGTEWIKE